MLVTLALVVASSLPYFIAWAVRPEGAHFTGLLVNPLDGHSYIAKMRQGLDGSWRFRLAFTPERHTGAYLFLLHIALGHVARWTGLPLIGVYHGARALAGIAASLVAYRVITRLGGEPRQRRVAFLLLMFSSGLGWLVAASGYLPADLWVPEAFFFYSILATPHFPLAIALMLVILMALAQPGREPGRREAMIAAIASIGLSIVQPFGVIPVYATLAVWLALRWLRDRRPAWRTVGWTAAAGLVAVAYPLYGVLAIGADPVLAGWSAQNLTPSPPVWDWLLSFGLLAVLAVLVSIITLAYFMKFQRFAFFNKSALPWKGSIREVPRRSRSGSFRLEQPAVGRHVQPRRAEFRRPRQGVVAGRRDRCHAIALDSPQQSQRIGLAGRTRQERGQRAVRFLGSAQARHGNEQGTDARPERARRFPAAIGRRQGAGPLATVS